MKIQENKQSIENLKKELNNKTVDELTPIKKINFMTERTNLYLTEKTNIETNIWQKYNKEHVYTTLTQITTPKNGIQHTKGNTISKIINLIDLNKTNIENELFSQISGDTNLKNDDREKFDFLVEKILETLKNL